jgi:hypothetical protein
MDYRQVVSDIAVDLLSTLEENHFNALSREQAEGIRLQLKKHPLVIDVLEELEEAIARLDEDDEG